MVTKVADRVQETSTTTGTGSFALLGAATGYQSFTSAFASSDVVAYCITDGTNWEVGFGTFTAPSTLARTTVHASSNAGAAVSFAAGTKQVFSTATAAFLTDSSAFAAQMAAAATAATGKGTPVDADELFLVDSAASNGPKKLTWANLKAGVFAAWGALIGAATGKTTPVNADAFAIMDSAASNATKSLTFTNLKAFLKTYFDTLYAAVGGGGGTSTVLPYPSPARRWFGASGVTVSTTSTFINADPFIVWDGTQWLMYYWENLGSSPYVKCYYRTAPTLEGPWSSPTNIASLDGYHKFALLVDEVGNPVVIGGNYHGYAVTLTGGSISAKEIWHFTCSTLTGTWTLGSKVIAKGGSGDKDEYNTDTPFAIYKSGTIYLWYMGAPASSLTTYGLAMRMLIATATNPDGAFTKNSTDVVLPSTTAAWDYGWMGGVQIRLLPDGTYMMVYNAGDTRPGTAGNEPNTSRIGYAYAPALTGPWTKDYGNPYLTPTNVPSDGGQTVESTNIWRGFMEFDRQIGRWYMFYNTGSGTEKITFARQGVYDYFDAHNGVPYAIQTITTSVVAIDNSRVNVTPGLYRVHYQYNVGDIGTTKPAINVDLALRVNGTAYRASREFVGSYNYENRDIIMRCDVPITGPNSYFDCTIQCTGGTPTDVSQVLKGRIVIEQIG